MEAGTGEKGVTPGAGAEGKILMPMQIYVQQEGNSVLESCWGVGCKEWVLGVAGVQDSGQAMLMVGAGEAGTSCARDCSPLVLGMAFHMPESCHFVAVSR